MTHLIATRGIALTLLSAGLWLVMPGSVAAQPAPRLAPEAVEFFETRVRPVLAEHCFGCHGPKKQMAGLRLDTPAFLKDGSDGGPVVVPGDPERSLLIRAVRHVGEVKMPQKGKLSDAVINDLAAWVKLGAPWPDAGAVKVADQDAWKTHWAFRPVARPEVPRPPGLPEDASPIDAFVVAQLQAKGLTLSPPADRRTLLRRATFGLTGLPPTAEEIEAFEADTSPRAWEKVVDRLLASPHYGERWARHWLDVARYSDTKGYVFEEERRFAFSYTYRDYVVRAFNEDKPYDRFLLEQLAADRLPDAEPRALAAMGFLTLGRRFLNNQHDIIDDRIDVTTRGLMGLTVSCARCHDHKYDPIPIKDYYSLYGVFASSVEPKELPRIGEPERTPEYLAFEAELKAREAAVAEYREKHKAELAAGNRKFRDGLRALQKKVDQWHVTSPAAPPRAMVLNDAPSPTTPAVFLRGNPNNRGPQVPRQFLAVLAGEKRQPFRQGSGRLEMARAIASPENPLTARVQVNRVWMHHFGAGLVRTPGDFGLRSDPPTHPELLDWLAVRFVEGGWSLKKLHREILLSLTYRQASRNNAAGLSIDPENHLLWRANRRRLDFEALRDALLAASGALDRKIGGASVDLFKEPFTARRTVYGFIDRQNLPGVFRTFDFASPDATTPQRHQTTVPQQALFLMNSPFVLSQARALLRHAEVAGAAGEEGKIQALHRRAYGRPADPEELALGLEFLASAGRAPGRSGLTAWERYAQVLLLANEFAFVD